MKKSTLKSILWIVRLQYETAKFTFILNFLFNIYDGVISIVGAYAAAQLLTSITRVAGGGSETEPVYIWLGVLLIIEVVGITLRTFNNLSIRRAEQKLEMAASEQFFVKLHQLSQEQFDTEEFNTMVSRAQDGLLRLWQVTNELTWATSSTVRFVAAITAIMVVAPVVAIVIIVTIIPITLVRIRRNKLDEEVNKKAEPIDRVAYRTRWYLLDPENMPEIRLVGGFKNLVHSWRTNMHKSQDMQYEVDRKTAKFDVLTDIVQPGIEFLANVYFFRLLVAGTIGLDRFIFLRSILDQASGSAASLTNSFNKLHELSIDLDNFETFRQTEPAIPNGDIKITRPLTIEFKDVTFEYPGANEPVLKDVSFLLVPGSKLALVGENGAGKTTLIKLLLRQYLPSKGQILVNGNDMKDVDQASYYEALSILSQDFLKVHHLTIKENLLMGVNREVNDEEIYENLDMVGAKEFVQKLSHKLGQRMDSSFKDGSNLSGGQEQRIGVARALLRGGDLMILDEPTSAIDAKAEFSIFNNIYKAHANRTTLIVSHRFSTVRKADKVIVMEQGKIIEYGSHEELMAHGGLYKEMFDLQAEGYR